MGRLFWKIFLGFWLSLVVIAVAVGFPLTSTTRHAGKNLMNLRPDRASNWRSTQQPSRCAMADAKQ
jgi:hypothetical protein